MALLLAMMALLAGGAARRESVAVDEVAHIGAGVSYLQKLDLRMNEEHPPLAKVLAALPLVLRRVHADYSHLSWTFSNKNLNENGFRLATSVGGVLTGRGGDYIIIDDPLKPDEAVSETRRKAVNEWFDQSLYSRLNDKQKSRIILVMQRLHEDDLVGHVLAQGGWKLLRFPAIAEEDQTYTIRTPYGTRVFQRRAGEPLDPEREPLEILRQLRDTVGEYNFAGQYQQAPAPLGGGMVKVGWFKTYTDATVPTKFDLLFQSWDTANKPNELSDYSVCTTWGVKDKHLYLLHVYRKRLDYPDLKRAVREQTEAFQPRTILIEDRASGTQLIQELAREGLHQVKRYSSSIDKIMRLNSVTGTMENGFVHLPEKAEWLGEYVHELSAFPNGKYDDQADSTSQALDWVKEKYVRYWFVAYCREEAEKLQKTQFEGPNFQNLHKGKSW